MKTLSYRGGQTPTAMLPHSERPGRRFAMLAPAPLSGEPRYRLRFAHFLAARSASERSERLQQESCPKGTPLKAVSRQPSAVSRRQGTRPGARLLSFSLTVFRLAHKCSTTPKMRNKTGICAPRILRRICASAHQRINPCHKKNAPKFLRAFSSFLFLI